MKAPGWRPEWHVGVRASKSQKLVASICGVPADIRVHDQLLHVSEINFLCIHKKLRSKRLTPVLIKEITRRCYVNGIYQAIYTGGVVLPKPVTSCRYYHRPLDWLKLYEVGFSPLPHGSTKARQITKNHLPSETATRGLRPMQAKDIDGVHDLLERYLNRFELNQAYSKEEIDHWLVHKEEPGKEQVVWSYVAEDPETHKITDFVSFYSLPSSVIQHPKHKEVRAAYLYYYATEAAFKDDDKVLKERLLTLINDALILAKRVSLELNSIGGLKEEGANITYRLISTSSTLSLFMTTLSSSSSSSSALVMDSCITTSSTTALLPSPAELMRRIFQTIRSGEEWVLFSCKKKPFLFLMHCRSRMQTMRMGNGVWHPRVDEFYRSITLSYGC